MTPKQKELIKHLVAGAYLVRWTNGKYRCCDSDGNPLGSYLESTVKSLDRFINKPIKLWKRDTLKRMTLNLSTVRQLHGKTTIKTIYNQNKSNEKSLIQN